MTIMSDAARIIGVGSPGDDGLSPLEHAEQLRTSAPKLAAILTRSAPVELARQYAEADTEALVAERTFKRWVIRANRAVLATATVSALLMAAALLAGRLGGLTQTILIVLALIGVATGGYRVDVAVSGEGGPAPRGLDDGARTGRDQAIVLLQ